MHAVHVSRLSEVFTAEHRAPEFRDLGFQRVHEVDMVLALGGEDPGDDDVGLGDDIARMPSVIHQVTIGPVTARTRLRGSSQNPDSRGCSFGAGRAGRGRISRR